MLRCMGCMAELPDGAQSCPFCGYVRGAAAREAYHLAPESILQGRYIIGRVLGYGGFGVTYIGYDASLERVVAVKEFLPSTFATRVPGNTAVTVYEGNATAQFGAGLERFVEEAQTLAQFNGIPGIVDIYDSFTGNNTAYIVMQFLKGRDVKDMLSAGGPLPYEQARDIILRVCGTLAPVHAKGIIHRDLSPDNLFLTDAGEVKLLDFGAARYESAVNSKSLSVILKAGYAPEEQYRSRGEQGAWTDVYALAATFYKMLTGVTPDDSMERAIKDELKEPSKLGAELPQSAENAIMNALNVRKADRTKTVTDFQNALLADGVERVKAKPHAPGAARMPVGARVAIIASAVALVLLGLFAATGGFGGQTILLGGTKLADNYGTAAREGYVNVPTLVGMMPDEAEAALGELGLTMEIGGYIVSEGAGSGKIGAQTPAAGKQVEEGSAVLVNPDIGDLADAMHAGRVDGIRGLPAGKVAAHMQNTTFHGIYYQYSFVYSGDVPAGEGVDVVRVREEHDSGAYEYYAVQLSAGPSAGLTPDGALRSAVLSDGGSLQFSVATSGGEIADNSVTHHLLVSPDGGQSWHEINGSGYGYYSDEYMSREEAAKGLPYIQHISFDRQLAASYPQFAGKDLLLRIERRQNANTPLDRLDLAQTFRFEFSSETVQVDNVTDLSYDEAYAQYQAGAFNVAPGNIEYYEWIFEDKEGWDYRACLRIEGNFEKNRSYYITFGDSFYEYLDCTTDGELIALVDRTAFTEQRATLLKNGYSDLGCDADGNQYLTIAQPAVLTPTGAAPAGASSESAPAEEPMMPEDELSAEEQEKLKAAEAEAS